MKNLEAQIRNLKRLSLADTINFYTSRLPIKKVRECQVAEGTEYYVEMLIEKYRETLRR